MQQAPAVNVVPKTPEARLDRVKNKDAVDSSTSEGASHGLGDAEFDLGGQQSISAFKEQANLRLRSADLSEQSEKIEGKLQAAEELIASFNEVVQESDPEKSEESRTDLIRKIDSIKQLVKDAEAPDITLGESKTNKSVTYQTTQPEAEDDPTKLRTKQNIEFATQNQDVLRQRNEKQITETTDEEKSRIASRKKAEEGITSVGQAEKERQEEIQEREDVSLASSAPKVVSLGDLVESLHQDLDIPGKSKNAKRIQGIRDNLKNKSPFEEEGIEGVQMTKETLLKEIAFDSEVLSEVDNRSEKTLSRLVGSLTHAPASVLNDGPTKEMGDVLDQTISQIKDFRNELKGVNQRQAKLNEFEKRLSPMDSEPTPDFREAIRIADDLSSLEPQDQMLKAQHRITPDAVSQLLF